jgi:hypothetical protein
VSRSKSADHQMPRDSHHSSLSPKDVYDGDIFRPRGREMLVRFHLGLAVSPKASWQLVDELRG